MGNTRSSDKYDVIRYGSIYHNLTVIREDKPYITPQGRSFRKFLCQCECGGTVVARGYNLRSGHTKSCGCLKVETIHKIRKKYRGK